MWGKLRLLMSGAKVAASGGPLALLNAIPWWVWAAALAALGGLAGVQYVHIKELDVKVANSATALAACKQERAEAQAAWEKQSREVAEEARAKEHELNRNKEKVDAIVSVENEKTAAAVRSGDAARSVLVAATEAADATDDGGSGNPGALARAEQRATALGKLLGTCDAVAGDLGRDVEGLGTQVRGLQSSYESVRRSSAAH